MVERVEYLHEKSYTHRDLKPENFCVGLGSRGSHKIYMMDYGLAHKY